MDGETLFDMTEFYDPKGRKTQESDAEREQKRRIDVKRRELKNLENKIERGLILSGPELRRRKELEAELAADKPADLPDGVVKTIREVAAHFQKTTRTIKNWAKYGMPHTDHHYDLKAIEAWAVTREPPLIPKPAVQESQTQDAETVVVSAKTHWETEYRKIQAQLKQIELDKAQGLLIPVEEVEDGRVARIMAVKRELLAVPRSLAPQLIGLEAREIEAMLTEKMREICGRFSGGG